MKEYLKPQCMQLHATLSDGDSYHTNSVDLFSELITLQDTLSEYIGNALQALHLLKLLEDSFPSKEISYRIVLTVSVTVAGGERSCSK
jgi:hypothetical protein